MAHVNDKAISEVLTGGNHLASALIGWLGASERTFPPYTTDPERAWRIIGDTNRYDAWLAWRAIMRFRDSVRPKEPAA